MQIRGKSALNDHKQEWQKLYELFSSEQNEQSQYKARCVLGLLKNETYDYAERIPKPVEISFIK